MPSNRAAWITSKVAKTLEVKAAPYTSPRENQIVVKNAAVSVNPLDWFKQMAGAIMFGWVQYPTIPGTDAAGEVVEVGKGVTRFKPGDRVVGHAVGWDKRSNVPSEQAFQEYTVLRTHMASPIPDSMSYENACVLPLCISTAACGLFMKDFLALQSPTSKGSPRPTGETLLVWGGSTSVGSNAIQLAKAAGYEVITTASPKNFEYVKRLGATRSFDYRSPTVVQDIIAEFKSRKSAGAIAIGDGSIGPCVDIIAACKGRKFVAQGSAAKLPDPFPSSYLGLASFISAFLWGSASMWFKSKVKGVATKFIFGSDLMANEVGKMIYEDFLASALAQGKYLAAPEPIVVGKGLEHVQEAFDLHKKGVSANKVVVTL